MSDQPDTPTDPPPPEGGPSNAGLDSAVVALGRAVQRALRRIDTVDKNVLQLAADVTALATSLTDNQNSQDDDGAAGQVPAVRSWLLADAPAFDARADLAQLIWWVERVYLHYSRVMLSSCWLWHPEVIEELTCRRAGPVLHLQPWHRVTLVDMRTDPPPREGYETKAAALAAGAGAAPAGADPGRLGVAGGGAARAGARGGGRRWACAVSRVAAGHRAATP